MFVKLACLLGLLFPYETTAFVGNVNSGVRSPAAVSLNVKPLFAPTFATSLRVGVSPYIEDIQPIGSGYRNLFIDTDIYPDVEKTSRRKKYAKAVAGSTAVVCAALLLKRLLLGTAALPSLLYLYKAYPIAAAMITCGVKSTSADIVSQIQAWKQDKTNPALRLCWRRILSGILYGSVITGFGAVMVYTKFMPLFVGPTMNPLKGMVIQSAMDNFFFAPFFWLPGAYSMKSLVFQRNELKQYFHDVRHQGLLQKYWSLWFPAQMITFSIIPSYLRVASTACIGFIWFLILTNLSYQNKD